MRVLCVADEVISELPQLLETRQIAKPDLLISCGDLPPEYLHTLLIYCGVPLYYVKGNHDIRYDKTKPVGCLNLHGRLVRYKGIRLLGLEGSRWYNGGPNQYTEGQMRRLVWRLGPRMWWRGGVDIVVAHAPPRFIHDAEDPCHRGFKIFRRLIQRHAPRYFLHGHIHASFENDRDRVTMISGTQVVNCYRYYQFEIDADPVDRKN
jgi:Icc-related predicted phosphoesterase